MTTPLPSLPPRMRSRSRHSPSSSRFTAHRLSSLASSLATSWDALDGHARAELAHRIQGIAGDLAAAQPEQAGPNDERLRFLTARELQVLHEIAEGASTSEVCTRLRLSANTVRSYIKSILSKLGVHSRLEAVTLLIRAEEAARLDGADGGFARSG